MCVKVVFPLPNGNAIVIMRPTVHEDGSFSVVSEGEAFGDPGSYFTVRRQDGSFVGRYLRALKEGIRVYPAQRDEVRADHTMTLGSVTPEPNGNIPPDFPVDDRIAVEARRLNAASDDRSDLSRT